MKASYEAFRCCTHRLIIECNAYSLFSAIPAARSDDSPDGVLPHLALHQGPFCWLCIRAAVFESAQRSLCTPLAFTVTLCRT